MTMTFRQLQDEFAKMDTFRLRSKLQDEISYILDAARVNADDTIYVEKAAPEGDYNRIAVDRLRDLLAYSKDKRLINWFAKRGVVS